MQKTVRTLTWNIGGGRLLEDGLDQGLISSYTVDGLEEIIGILKATNADVIAIQEAHWKDGYDQVAIIAKSLGFQHYFYDSTSRSHIDTSCMLGHGIISRFPISNHIFGLFTNPHLSAEWEDGSIAHSFDKGYSTCDIDLGTIISFTTLHLVPFRRFGIDTKSPQAQAILEDVVASIKINRPQSVVMGDFNIDSTEVEEYLKGMFYAYKLSEVSISEPTTPKNRKYDHILYSGLSLQSLEILNEVKTDHYPVICDFSL